MGEATVAIMAVCGKDAVGRHHGVEACFALTTTNTTSANTLAIALCYIMGLKNGCSRNIVLG